MPERAGILHSWAYIRQVQLGGQGSSEMVRHPSEQSSTFRSVTYDCLNVRSPFQVWCKCYAKVLVLSHSLNRVAVNHQWGVSCFSYVQQLCFFVSKSPIPAQSPLLSIVYRSLECRGVCRSCVPRECLVDKRVICIQLCWQIDV